MIERHADAVVTVPSKRVYPIKIFILRRDDRSFGSTAGRMAVERKGAASVAGDGHGMEARARGWTSSSEAQRAVTWFPSEMP